MKLTHEYESWLRANCLQEPADVWSAARNSAEIQDRSKGPGPKGELRMLKSFFFLHVTTAVKTLAISVTVVCGCEERIASIKEKNVNK